MLRKSDFNQAVLELLGVRGVLGENALPDEDKRMIRAVVDGLAADHERNASWANELPAETELTPTAQEAHERLRNYIDSLKN